MVLPGHEIVAGVSEFAASAMAAALWQGILLAGAAALGLRLLPETPAPVRFAIWFGVFLLVAGLPFATVWMPQAGAATAAAVHSHAWLTLDARWCVWVGALWAAASLVRASTLIAAGFRVRALWKRTLPIELALPQIERKAQVCISDEVDRPTVIGFFSPKIVIPSWLIAKLTPAELEQVVLHEAGHLSRRDDWLNLLQKFALVIFPLNPALAWVERRLCFERELACDEHVLAATGAPKAYAECLATLAEYRLQRRGLVQGLALALGALGRESELTKRVLRILSGGTRMKKNHARLVFGGSMLTLVFAASAMERSPQVVGFSHGEQASLAEIHDSGGDGMRAVAVRASVAPADQWKTVGDAVPHVAKRAIAPVRPVLTNSVERANAVTSAAKAAVPTRAVYGIRSTLLRTGSEAVPLSKTGSEVQAKSVAADAPYAPEMIQTVATERQVTADGRVLVTRMVMVRAYNVSNPDASESVPDVQESQPTQKLQQVVHRYAAVPVQGGWLVFQL